MLDTVRIVDTPEGIALRLPAAGPVPRALAWAIDLAIRMALLMLFGMVLGMLGSTGAGLYLVALFVVFWGYPILCEGLFGGQTPGKRVLGLRVVAGDGAPVGWLASIVRNLMRTVDMLPFGYACGLIAGFSDPWGRRLGDLVAGTLVVHVHPVQPLPVTVAGGTHAPLSPLRPEEQVAVLAFAERAPRLTPERQMELADLVTPITGAQGAAGVARLGGIARWLLGQG